MVMMIRKAFVLVLFNCVCCLSVVVFWQCLNCILWLYNPVLFECFKGEKILFSQCVHICIEILGKLEKQELRGCDLERDYF